MTLHAGEKLASRAFGWEALGGPALLGPALAALGYYLGAEAAFLIGTLSDKIFAPFWPPNVVLFVALLLTPYRRWWLIFAAVLPVHVLAELRVGMTPLPMAVAFATNAMVAVMNAVAVRYFLGGPPWLSEARKTLRHIV